MAPGQQVEEVAVLKQRLVELETLINRLQRAAEEEFRQVADCAPFAVWTSGLDA